MKKNMLIYGIILIVIGVVFAFLGPFLAFYGAIGSGTNTGLIIVGNIAGIIGFFLLVIGGILAFIGIIVHFRDEIGPGLTSTNNLDPFQTTQKTQTRYCPSCGRSIPFDSVICP